LFLFFCAAAQAAGRRVMAGRKPLPTHLKLVKGTARIG
jgi:hypothetical protein